MGFSSHGVVIPGTPIAIDLWKVAQHTQAKVFFLTHCHADHLVGLTRTWRHPIYTTSFNARWLAEKRQIPSRLFIALNAGCSMEVPLDSCGAHKVLVTAIDAYHVPGAVMFLFQGYFGTVLYTGDFRYYPALQTQPGLVNLEEGEVDVLYLDNTYCHPRHRFPCRDTASISILNIIRCHPHHHIKLGCRNLGREELFVFLGLQLQELLLVPPDNLLTFQLLRAYDVFTTDPAEARIHLVPMLQISKKNHELWNTRRPTISIRPSAMVVGARSEGRESAPLQCCPSHPCCQDALEGANSDATRYRTSFSQSTEQRDEMIPDDLTLLCEELENDSKRGSENENFKGLASSVPHISAVVTTGAVGPNTSKVSSINGRSPPVGHELSPPTNDQCLPLVMEQSSPVTDEQPQTRSGGHSEELGSQVSRTLSSTPPPSQVDGLRFGTCDPQERDSNASSVGGLKRSLQECSVHPHEDSKKIFAKRPLVKAFQDPASSSTLVQLTSPSSVNKGLEDSVRVNENISNFCADEQQECGKRRPQTMLSQYSPIKMSESEQEKRTPEMSSFALCSSQMELSVRTPGNSLEQSTSSSKFYWAPSLESDGNDSTHLSSETSLPSSGKDVNSSRLSGDEVKQPNEAAKENLGQPTSQLPALEWWKNTATKCLCSQIKKYQNSVPGMFTVPYSDHCDFNELRMTVSLIKPRAVVPVVRSCSWKVPDAELYSDMSCFDDLLSTRSLCPGITWNEMVEASVHEAKSPSSSNTAQFGRLSDRTPRFQIPAEVWSSMHAFAPALPSWPRIRRKRYRMKLARKQLRKGVHFEELV